MAKRVAIDHFGEYLCPSALGRWGERILFIGKTTDWEENRYRSDLYCLEGEKPVRLTHTGDVTAYWVVENGVIFRSVREKKDAQSIKDGYPLSVFYLLPACGEATELFRLEENVESAVFADAEHALLTVQRDPRWEEALAGEGDAQGAAKAMKEEADYAVLDEVPFWGNGQGMTNGLRSRLYRYEKGVLTALSEKNTAVEDVVVGDGRKALFLASAFEGGVLPYHNELCEADLTTGRVRRLSPLPQATYGLHAYLPEGGILFFANEGKRRGMNENDSVYRCDADGKNVTLLYGGGMFCAYSSVGSDIRLGGPAQPQLWVRGDAYYFLSTVQESSFLMKGSLQGGEPVPLGSLPGAVCEALPAENGFLAVGLRGNEGPEIAHISFDGGERRVSALNTHIAPQYELSVPEPLVFTGEKGWEIHGFVLPPVGREAGKKYPVILDIHGGPKTVYGTNFFHEMQYWAGQGYAVLFCNPTGGDGRGDAFADIRGQYGQADYRDIMTFVDKALEKWDYLDGGRMGVTGGSYGGFMTNWIIGHTDRFACAASQRSIANWVSFYGTSDIGYFFGPDQTGGTPWQGLDKAWEQSPLRYAPQVKTPTLFIHSDEDYRCWMAEGLQMFTALKAHGVPARLCLFHGENHELSRSGKPKHRVRRLREITQWMDTYLKKS
ncbi:MAG: S9 family peptidase [Eubacteriales bacterium]|nr:S9 family peptidase [Eubacteriales bacterium]